MGKRKPKPIQEHEIRRVPLSVLRDAPYNPQVISKEARDGLEASLETLGNLQLIVWNERTGHVVGGHKRLAILREHGAEETTVVVVDMDEAAEKTANVTLNNPHITGEFSDGLPDVLAEIREAIALEDFMALRLDVLDDPILPDEGEGEGGGGEGADPDMEALDKIPERPPALTKKGDAITLGPHVLRCEGCLEVMRGLDENSVDAICTDPPYALGFMGKQWDTFSEDRENAGFFYWLAGFTDGEGHFGIKQHTRGTSAPFFAISLRADDLPILQRIKRVTGIGSIVDKGDKTSKNPGVRYVVQTQADCQRLVDIFDKYPLRAKKAVEFGVWRDAVIEWTERPRGNRWTGPADNNRMAWLNSQLKAIREFKDIPWSGDAYQDWVRLWAQEALRVLKPGGHMVAFSAPRKIHRLTAGIEDAGFEIRDQIGWLTWQGFPKSLDISKAIDAHRMTGGSSPQRMADAREQSGQSVAGGGVRHAFSTNKDNKEGVYRNAPGTGAHWEAQTDDAKRWHGFGTALKPAQEPAILARKPLVGTVAQNVLEWGTGGLNIDACRYAYGDDAWPGPSSREAAEVGGGIRPVRGKFESYKDADLGLVQAPPPHDLGRWPANIYYCPKPSTTEREAGTEYLAQQSAGELTGGRAEGSAGLDNPRAGAGRKASSRGNIHPTVKPAKLMRWLLRLVSPPGAVVLEPFAGSGSTLVAAHGLDLQILACEIEPEYCDIIRARVGALDG